MLRALDRVLKISSWFLALLALASIIVVLATVLQNPDTTGPVYLALINVNLILAIILAIYIGRRILLLFIERQGQLLRARLPVRLMGVFAVLAVLPALVVSAFSIVMLNQGIEAWFSRRVSEALEGSLQVAQAYLDEHEQRLLSEVRALARSNMVSQPMFLIDPEIMQQFLDETKNRQNLAEALIYHSDGTLISQASDFAPSPLPPEILRLFKNDDMEAATFNNMSERRLVAAAPINEDTWLVLSRLIHPSVLARMDQTHEAYQEYFSLRKDRDQIRLIFTLFLTLLALCSLAAAIWAGLRMATRITRPVAALVKATNRVSSGDLDVRVDPQDDDEIGILTQSFNRMAKQLKEGRALLERKNRELDDRRRTTEAVLTGVTAGVIALDEKGTARQANKVARDMLDARMNTHISKISPEVSELFETFLASGQDLMQQQIRVEKDGEARMLLVRMVTQKGGGGKVVGVIVTFDDVTALVSAQRVAAWSDVARKLAHEIKNPLTPIQLSAERLRRKYGKQIHEDAELFNELTETIGRRVEDMRGMLNEFSDFARMPAAKFGEEDVIGILDEVLLLQRTARNDVDFETDYEVDHLTMTCDRVQLNRAFTNIIENAVNAIYERPDDKKDEKGHIKIVVKMSQADTLAITVQDNGRGLPEDMQAETLFDPYVTTRKKGTGLGLAIVRRVVEEHKGQVRLVRRDDGGTQVELNFPVTRND